MRRSLTEAEFLRLAFKEAESPIVAAGRKPNPDSFPSSNDSKAPQGETSERPRDMNRLPKKRSFAGHTN